MATTTRRITASGFPEGRLTAEAFWESPGVEGKQYELVNGEVIEMPGAGAEHGTIAMQIIAALLTFVRPPLHGRVYGGDVTYMLTRAPDTLRVPDVSFVSRERVAAHGIPKGYWPFPPDLAVEIASPHDRARERREKLEQYLAAGVRLVWIVQPAQQTITVHTLDDEPREYGADDTLDGGDVLPGFIVTVRDLFDLAQ